MNNTTLFAVVLLVGCVHAPAPASMVGAPPPGPWEPLFDGSALGRWQPTMFGGEGAVRAEAGRLMLYQGDPLTGVTWSGEPPARLGYELELEAMRVAGSDFFCGLTFPVGADTISLIVGGWGGALVGLSNLDDADASENETTRTMTFLTGRWYRIRVRVTVGRIQAWIDEAKLVDIGTGGRRVGIRPEVDASRPLGIASFRTTAALRNLRLRRL